MSLTSSFGGGPLKSLAECLLQAKAGKVHQACPVTVLRALCDKPPFYLACAASAEVPQPGEAPRACNRKVQPQNGSWHCTSGHVTTAPIARYILRLEVADASKGSSAVTAFDQEAQRLLGVPAARVADLWDRRLSGDAQADGELKALLGSVEYRRWSFGIRSKIESFDGRERTKLEILSHEEVPLVAHGREMLRAISSACE